MNKNNNRKLLILARFLPHPEHTGGRIRAAAFLRWLSSEFSVTLVAFLDNDQDSTHVEELLPYCEKIEVIPFSRNKFKKLYYLFKSLLLWQSYRTIQFYSPKIEKILDKLDLDSFDIIQVEELAMMHYIKQPLKSKVILDQHNVEANLVYSYMLAEKNILKKAFAYLEFIKLNRFEIKAISRSDLCLAVSADDYSVFCERVTKNGNLMVVRGGVNTEYFYPRDSGDSEPNIVFVGTMMWVPNIDGMHYFVDEIFPAILNECPNVKFFIVGSRPVKSIMQLNSHPNINVTGTVPDTRPFLHRNSVGIVPLRIGSGIRVKILQSLSMGQAIVSTSLGCEGLNFKSGSEIALSDDPASFAEWVIKLLQDSQLRYEMGRRGRNIIEKHYSWKTIFNEISPLYIEKTQ